MAEVRYGPSESLNTGAEVRHGQQSRSRSPSTEPSRKVPLCNAATGWDGCENGLATHALAVSTDNQHRLVIPITPEASTISSRYQKSSTDPGAMAQAQVQRFPLRMDDKGECRPD